MKFKRLAASAVVVVPAVFGLGLATAGPAAADAGSWRAYGNTNPITSSDAKWACARTQPVSTDVSAQVCAVRSRQGRGNGVQTAVIVRNNRSSSYPVEAAADMPSGLGGSVGRWECSRSGVAANSWSVCFGTTEEVRYPISVQAHGGANGVDLGVSPWV
jgi:hypothetical protein